MKLFSKFLKTEITNIIVFLIFIVLFVSVFYLYGLPIAAIIYPALLCIFIGALVIAIKFFKTKKKYIEIANLKNQTAEMISTLPNGETICEEQYKEWIYKLKEEIISNKSADETEYSDMVDYYTMWAHQIKTPVASMKLALQNEKSAQSRQLLSDLFHIEQYVDMVLAFLRIGSESTDYVFKKCRLDEIIRTTAKKFTSEFIMRKLSFNYEPTELEIITDEKWLSFVLEQLFSNSLKYTKKGGISVKVICENILCIEDTGIGIAPEDLPRIFEKGYTGINGRSYKSASGLGLYLCKQICEKLGFDIKIRSEAGKGTTVLLDCAQNKNF